MFLIDGTNAPYSRGAVRIAKVFTAKLIAAHRQAVSKCNELHHIDVCGDSCYPGSCNPIHTSQEVSLIGFSGTYF